MSPQRSPGQPSPLDYQTRVKCPKCGSPESKPVSFTWWGGVVGPKILHHVKCLGCGQAYNGKSGKLNTTAIIIWNVVIFGLAFVIFFGIGLIRR